MALFIATTASPETRETTGFPTEIVQLPHAAVFPESVKVVPFTVGATGAGVTDGVDLVVGEALSLGSTGAVGVAVSPSSAEPVGVAVSPGRPDAAGVTVGPGAGVT